MPCRAQVAPSVTIKNIPVSDITGNSTSLNEVDAEVILVVNVASKCGLTPQYEGLEALYREYKDRGFAICGFPANDFLGQEPGTNEEIAEFCSTNFDVTFPLFSKIVVTGDDKHELYRELIAARPETAGAVQQHRERLEGFGIATTQAPEVLWNFEKFLIGRDGSVVGRFSPNMTPEDPELRSAIDAALAG